ncbi:nicotinate-nucleotide adenylyltransferase [Roseinatronobacter monicus]|uniref:Probable nicotinate-nucleotide adenylyltransferase n=1 Tax=Roseinatronobacter monicus TaxID=393481 RepID=A0A543KEB6_9RHOB|nr:nicotinate-nucleotide adenylyltransferase [Roseinatronobacter monicus]TQM93426.1 nicotinate-nucleotide adenylyltransferase [Roseinatronobacter monicus]
MPVLPRHDLPFAPRRASVGLFGGSFDPAHEGHVHVTRHALQRLELDRLWWLVSPGNPLKSFGPAPLQARLTQARKLMRHPRVDVTPVESLLGTRYTADTLRALMHLYPERRFVWIMGADNLASFHQWDNWRVIMESLPIAVVARPGQQLRALSSVAARRYARARIPARSAPLLSMAQAPAWCFLTVPLRDISSSHLRAQGNWLGTGHL